MSSHLASPRSLATLTAIALAGLVSGCSSGRQQAQVYVPETQTPTVAQAAPAPILPVVTEEEPASATAPAPAGTAAEEAADKRRDARERREARRELREERARAARARKRAEAREEALRIQLSEARRRTEGAGTVAAAPAPAEPSAPITASDVSEAQPLERNARSEAEARAAVVRFHQLLDNRNSVACWMLTPRMLETYYGKDQTAALHRCRDAVHAIQGKVSVTVTAVEAEGRQATLDVVTRQGDAEQAQTLSMRLVDGSWLLDTVEAKPSS